MAETILFALWFFAPAGLANAAPVFATRVSSLDFLGKPLDSEKSWHGKRIFGSHKTWRGLLSGIIVGILTGLLQFLLLKLIDQPPNWLLDPINYQNGNIIILGALLGGGALIGDAIKSFFKRRSNVPSGASWFPYDQLDYVAGALLFSLPFVQLNVMHYLAIIALWFGLHIATVYVGWKLGLRKKPI